MPSEQRAAVGEWHDQELSVDYLSDRVVHCACCGRGVPRRVWQAIVDGATERFCGPACEHVYREWWLPRHGRASATGE